MRNIFTDMLAALQEWRDKLRAIDCWSSEWEGEYRVILRWLRAVDDMRTEMDKDGRAK